MCVSWAGAVEPCPAVSSFRSSGFDSEDSLRVDDEINLENVQKVKIRVRKG